jgi:hypothetical protein
VDGGVRIPRNLGAGLSRTLIPDFSQGFSRNELAPFCKTLVQTIARTAKALHRDESRECYSISPMRSCYLESPLQQKNHILKYLDIRDFHCSKYS